MASRYWVAGGTGNWSSTTNWSATSGGSGGASVPTSADDVFINASSGTSPNTNIDATSNCLSLDFTGAITPTLLGTSTLNVYGSLTLIASLTLSFSGFLMFLATSAGKTVTSAGLTYHGNVYFNGSGGGWTLQDDLNLPTVQLAVLFGTLTTNSRTLTFNDFNSNTANTRSMVCGSSILNCAGSWTCTNSSNFTFTAGTSALNMTGTTKIFAGGSLTYNNVAFTGTPITVTGSNTFSTWTLTAGKTVKVTAGTTQSFSTLSGSGTSGSLITLQSTSAGVPYTFNKTSGIVLANFYSIQDNTATGGSSFQATNSIDVSGNTGWAFAVFLGVAAITATANSTVTFLMLSFNQASVTANALSIANGSAFIISAASVTGTATSAGASLILYNGVAAITATASGSATGVNTALGISSVTATASTSATSVLIVLLLVSSSVTATATATIYGVMRLSLGLADALTNFFYFNGKAYIMDGTNYLQWDGTTLVDVTSIAYIPTLTLGRAPTGGGTANENFNLLGAGFRDSFSSTGSGSAYTLSLLGLDATLVTATVNGVAKVETTDFTVNRTTGVVTFGSAPTAGTNNVVITAYKTIAGNANKIRNCKAFVIYGGNNDTRIFWANNINYPNYLFRSGLFDPTYAPDLAFVKIGSDAGIIQGFAKQFSSCVILKAPTPDDTTQWSMSYSIDSSGVVTFPIIPLTDDIGVVAPRSIQIIDGIPVYHSQKGIYQTVGSNVRDERNVSHLSQKIDRSYNNQIQALLAETLANQKAAVSVDYDKKYILNVNGRAYVYDYKKSTPQNLIWYIWDNIHASCFLEVNDYLYFGSNLTGVINKFQKIVDPAPNSDNGSAINAYWKSRIESFGTTYRFKTVPNVYLSIKPAVRTSATLSTVDDQGETVVQDTIIFSQFAFSNFDFGNFSFITTNFPQVLPSRVKAKKILYFQVLVSNFVNNESLGILEVDVEYTVNGLAK